MCLCCDLVLTLWSPFTPASSRAKQYYMVSGAGSVILMLYLITSYQLSRTAEHGVPQNCDKCLNRYNTTLHYDLYGEDKGADYQLLGTMIQSPANIVLAFTLSIYICVAVYSVIFAYRRLQRPGVSKSVRDMFWKKHATYVLVFIVIWVVQLSNNYFVLTHPRNKNNLDVLSEYLGYSKFNAAVMPSADNPDLDALEETTL